MPSLHRLDMSSPLVDEPPPPPGLDTVKVSVPDTCETGTLPPEWLENIRKFAVREADAAFQSKVAELWNMAQTTLLQVEERNRSSVTRLEAEVRRCTQRTRELEEEGARLKEELQRYQQLAKNGEQDFAKPRAPLSFSPLETSKAPLAEMWPPGGIPKFPFPTMFGDAPWPQDTMSAPKAKMCADAVRGASKSASTTSTPSSVGTLTSMTSKACFSSTPSSGLEVSPSVSPCDSAAQRMSLSEMIQPSSPQPSRPTPEPRDDLSVTPTCTQQSQRSRTPQRTPQPETPPWTPKRAQQCRPVSSLPPQKSPVPSPFTILEGGGVMYRFTLRRADDVQVGLETFHNIGEKALRVQGVTPDSAIDAWNRQCVTGPAAGKNVMPGDTIVSVNSVCAPMDMLSEMENKQLLKFTIVRGDAGSEATRPSCQESAKSKGCDATRVPSVLRVDADEFVPVGGA